MLRLTLLVVVPAVEVAEEAVVAVDLAVVAEEVVLEEEEVVVGLLLRHDQAAAVGQVAELVVRVPVVGREEQAVRGPAGEPVVLAGEPVELERAEAAPVLELVG